MVGYRLRRRRCSIVVFIHAMHDVHLLSVVCPKETTGGFDIDLNIDHRGAGILSAEVRKRELGDWQPSGYHDVDV